MENLTFNKRNETLNHICETTQRINNCLHFKFGMSDLQERMIFTAVALVVHKYRSYRELQQLKVKPFFEFKNGILQILSIIIDEQKNSNVNWNILLEEYNSIRMSITEDSKALNGFIDNIDMIASLVDSEYCCEDDIIAIFFNEFNRYRATTDSGQVFTPEHIISFMCRLIDVSIEDHVLDATCGVGSVLVKAMRNMLNVENSIISQDVGNSLYGIEMYRKMYALACTNILLHKNYHIHLAQLDAKSKEAKEWIRRSNITKVLMNPPHENRYSCVDIVTNVLDSVPMGTKCAILLPDKKVEKESKLRKIIDRHTLTTIIKLPENIFPKVEVPSSIFVFETGIPQNGQNILGYYIDGTSPAIVKGNGYQNVNGYWSKIEEYWIEAIRNKNDYKYNTMQIINPKERLFYQLPQKPKTLELYEEDFVKTIMDYEIFKRGMDVKDFTSQLAQKILYSSKARKEGKSITLFIKGEADGKD